MGNRNQTPPEPSLLSFKPLLPLLLSFRTTSSHSLRSSKDGAVHPDGQETGNPPAHHPLQGAYRVAAPLSGPLEGFPSPPALAQEKDSGGSHPPAVAISHLYQHVQDALGSFSEEQEQGLQS